MSTATCLLITLFKPIFKLWFIFLRERERERNFSLKKWAQWKLIDYWSNIEIQRSQVTTNIQQHTKEAIRCYTGMQQHDWAYISTIIFIYSFYRSKFSVLESMLPFSVVDRPNFGGKKLWKEIGNVFDDRNSSAGLGIGTLALPLITGPCWLLDASDFMAMEAYFSSVITYRRKHRYHICLK